MPHTNPPAVTLVVVWVVTDMILGIGTDIVRTARFSEIISRHPHRLRRLAARILHRSEYVDHGRPVQQLASAWAAKEALYKALSADDQSRCRFNEWRKVWTGQRYELVSDSPRGDEVLLSLSHDGDYTIAMVIRQLKLQK